MKPMRSVLVLMLVGVILIGASGALAQQVLVTPQQKTLRSGERGSSSKHSFSIGTAGRCLGSGMCGPLSRVRLEASAEMATLSRGLTMERDG